MTHPLRWYEQRFQPFTDDEAWQLFRLAAFGEAIGWTLLIIGICLRAFVTGGNNWPVAIAGRIHGTVFIVYMAAGLLLYPSLRWSRWVALLAIMASVPPFGSLILEQLIARFRQLRSAQQRLYVTCYYLALR